MPIPLERARQVIVELQAFQKNLFAQAHAKHVLHEVKESPENFPAFDPELDDKVTFLVYSLLAAGCSLIEHGYRPDGNAALERAGSLLHYIHGPHSPQSPDSTFHILVAGMSFYAAGHYSRAFVTLKDIEKQTEAAQAITAFLRKNNASLIEQLNKILLVNNWPDDNQLFLDQRAITVAIARALAFSLEFTATGTQTYLESADQQLKYASIVAAAAGHPAWWWIVRLLRLMLSDLGGASPWQVLPPYYDPDSTDTLGRYIRLLAFSKLPITELWLSQRAALPLALDVSNSGAVINLRTSAGKTRVAELAIMQVLLADPSARVFYLAPFRSLAIEVEHTLSATFTWLGHEVSHLYGGSRISSVDTELAADSAITIATPEKARALFRAAPELFAGVKLIIVDEGHLIGPSERYVRNEIFIDHLRRIASTTKARILLLSAVLPNAKELAEWVTGDEKAVISSEWKPSAERFGLLRWNGSRVKIDWQGDVASFNPSFIETKPLGFGTRRKPFPSNKNEAIAAAAVRMSAIGPAMIFTARAVSVPTLAEAALLALGQSPPNYPWPEHEWRVFEAVCEEELEPDAIELRAARAGIVCHSNRLAPQVRLAIEHLMRAKPPKIIIATTTLAQGVNVGISSVIIATPYIDKDAINKRDFWNICGRAGRAFVDGEGKILYTIDETRKPWQIEKDEALARYYFDRGASDRAESGILFIVGMLKDLASSAKVSFELLIELAANNDFSKLGTSAPYFERVCDLLDDELLALHTDPLINPSDESPAAWIEQVFQRSLAAIQARTELSGGLQASNVFGFLAARAESTLRRVEDPAVRKAVVSSGLPLSVALRAHIDLDAFREAADLFMASGETLAALVTAIQKIENWAREHGSSVTGNMPDSKKLDALRGLWLSGTGLRQLSAIDNEAASICKDLYGYQLPWVIHATSQQLRSNGEDERSDALATIALLLELGVPSELSARIFLAGIRSRKAAAELATLEVPFSATIPQLKRQLCDAKFAALLRPLITQSTAVWLDLMIAEALRSHETAPEFPDFSLTGVDTVSRLYSRKLGDKIFLSTLDGQTKIEIAPTDTFPFDKIANDPRIAFERTGTSWRISVRDPRLAPVSKS